MTDTLPAPSRRAQRGFTPIRRAFFLDRLAEGAVVSAAARAAGVSPTAAYNHRNRDPLFAAGWEAALELARAPLADALYERAVLGVTATYFRDPDNGEVHRHHHDNRLAATVLARLDARARAADDRPQDEAHHWRNILPFWADYTEYIAIDDRTACARILLGLRPPPSLLVGAENALFDGRAVDEVERLYAEPLEADADNDCARQIDPPTHRQLSQPAEGDLSYSVPQGDAAK
ncbi:hypothetical protein [Sphingomicrobium arenosum]|uniref:hypothetical protein n=1 Tax=Sphingomicrobium arenosum TaxID=2233861 RepID=UPI0022409F46|nr:hypothetical protein [Sphingomicrobium arenosum]